jgi:cob(I)alamin adenosyltransferase
MTPFYTGDGDTGDTGYLGKGRLSKSSLRIDAVGSVDEANAALGMARAMTQSEKTRMIILHVQKTLYQLMAEISAALEAAASFRKIDGAAVAWLEEQIASLENAIVLPRDFIVPGETPASGALSLARTIVRRAERRVTALMEAGEIDNRDLIAYLNRLSSLIFVLEVYEASQFGRGIQLAKEE